MTLLVSDEKLPDTVLVPGQTLPLSRLCRERASNGLGSPFPGGALGGTLPAPPAPDTS